MASGKTTTLSTNKSPNKGPPPPGKAIAVPGDTAQAVVPYTEQQLAELAATDDYADMGRADVAVPFLKVLQGLSPQCTVGNADYDEEARPGMITHSISKVLYATGVTVTPVVYKRSYLEWVPRKQGGGFRGEFPIATHEAIFNKLRDPKTGKATLPETGNDLIETLSFFVLLHNEDGTVEPAIIAMASTQTGTARVWNQLQMRYVPPGAPMKSYKRYTARYRLGTDMRRKDQNTWFVWKVNGAQVNDQDTLFAARAFEQQVLGNRVIVDHAGGAEPDSTTEDGM